jgi:hypothetical protein
MTNSEVISFDQYGVNPCKKAFNDEDKMDNCIVLDAKQLKP